MRQEQKEKITNHIIEALEKGNIPWVSPFERQIFPTNFFTGKTYQGVNLLVLWVTAKNAGYTGNYWIGFRQANQLGGMVLKGEKGVPITVCCPSKRKKQSKDDEQEMTYYYKTDYVFNLYSQVQGIEFEDTSVSYKSVEELDVLVKNTGAYIRHQGERAYYNLDDDLVNMPFRSKFITQEGYYQTLAHELVHYTMKDCRCNRQIGKDDEARALEELTAEIGSAFLLAEFGMKADLQNSTAYIQSWIKALKNDTGFIFKAAKQASDAVQFLMSFEQKKEVA